MSRRRKSKIWVSRRNKAKKSRRDQEIEEQELGIRRRKSKI